MALQPFSVAVVVGSNDPLVEATNYKVGAEVYVKLTSAGNPLADVYLDEAGANPITQPLISNSRGLVEFFANAGQYLLEYNDGQQLLSTRVGVGATEHSALLNLNAAGAHEASAISRGASNVDADLTAVEDSIENIGEQEVTATGSTTPRRLDDRFADVVNVKDYGVVSGSDITSVLNELCALGKKIYLPAGQYFLSDTVTPASGTHLFSDDGAEIVITKPTVENTYNQAFVANDAISNITVEGVKFSTSNASYSAFGFYGQVTGLKLINNECEGCALVTTFAGAVRAEIRGNYIHSPVSELVFSDYERAIQLSCNYNTTGSSDILVSDNIILGSWTHGIEITGNSVYDQEDPLQPKNVNRVVVANNIVRAITPNRSAGAIWFAQVADVTVTGNVCELYGDVGIDFESCTNAVAIGNTLKNNNKNLAMYGNSNGVLFEGNVCYNTTNPSPNTTMPMFYAKPVELVTDPTYVVDARNTNISLKNNTFHFDGTPTGFERLDMGSGGDIEVFGNTLINVGINATFKSLTSIVIKDNRINIEQNESTVIPIIVGQSYALGDSNTAAFDATITGNKINVAVNTVSYGILYQDNDTVNANVDVIKRLAITDNNIAIGTGDYGIYVQQTSTVTPENALNCRVLRNQTWGSITLDESGNRNFNKHISDNTTINGAPYSTTNASVGGVGSFVLPHELSYISTEGGSANLYVTLPDGEYNGQIKHVIMSGKDPSWNGVIIITNHRLGPNQQATFSAVGQYATLAWNINRWDTVSATCAGI